MDFAKLAARLRIALTVEDAKEVLGFPPGYQPSPLEVTKAWRAKSLQHHPDRGGDLRKMVEVNVAKDILEGKQRPGRPREVDPEEEARRARARARAAALQVIDRESKTVGDSLDQCLRFFDITRGKLHLRDFFSEELASAVDKVQDDIEDSDRKDHRDMKLADSLCQSLASKSVRLNSKFLALQKLQGDAVASMMGMTKGVSLDDLKKLVTETEKFITMFETIVVESRKLATLINTSEDVPLHWDDIMYRPHQILLAFSSDFRNFSGRNAVNDYKTVLERGIQASLKAIREADPKLADEAMDWDGTFPGWFTDVTNKLSNADKNASARRIARRFTAR